MDTPVIIVNLKTYEQGSCVEAAAVAEACEAVANERGANIAVAVQNADIHRVSELVDVPVLAQHVDPHAYGSNTGKDIVETLAFNGADGVLINHSEDQVDDETIERCVERAQDLGLETVVCADSPEKSAAVSAYGPDYVAYEPPELIGGDVSVSTAKPELVEDAVERSDATVFCGAGVKDGGDVATALELGAEGVLIASGVVKADDVEAALEDLVSGLEG